MDISRLMVMALYIAHDRDTKYYSTKLTMFLVILVLVDVVLTCYQVSSGNIDVNKEFESALSRAYDLGTKDLGGGVIGAVLAYPLI